MCNLIRLFINTKNNIITLHDANDSSILCLKKHIPMYIPLLDEILKT